MADEVDSKSIGSDTVRVQVPQPALLGRGESLKNNMVYVVFKAFSFLQRKIESCSQDSPPAAGRFSDTLPLCRSAIPSGAFFMSSDEVSYDITKSLPAFIPSKLSTHI